MRIYLVIGMVFLGLLASNVYGETNDKPFKICPEIVTAKDTPCRTLGPTVSVLNRSREAPDFQERQIKDLTEKLHKLKQENEFLKQQNSVIEKEKSKIEHDKPTSTRSIRG